MTNIRICLNKKDFDKDSKIYLEEYDKNDYDEVKGTTYQIDNDIDIDSFEVTDSGINLCGTIEGSKHYVHIDLDLDDDDFLNLLKIVLSKMNKWKEAMKAIKTVKEIEVKKEKIK